MTNLTKKILLYAVVPSVTMVSLGALVLPKTALVSPIAGGAAIERTLTIDVSNNAMFNGTTGPQSAASNTVSGNPITFTANYVTPSGASITPDLAGEEAPENKYTMHAKNTAYWCFFTHDLPFGEITSVAVNKLNPEKWTVTYHQIPISGQSRKRESLKVDNAIGKIP